MLATEREIYSDESGEGHEYMVKAAVTGQRNMFSVVTRSVSLGDLWPAGCWDRTGVDVVAAGFSWVCILLMFSWCGLNVLKPF